MDLHFSDITLWDWLWLNKKIGMLFGLFQFSIKIYLNIIFFSQLLYYCLILRLWSQYKLLSITFRMTLHWLVSHEMHRRSKCNYATICGMLCFIYMLWYIFFILLNFTHCPHLMSKGDSLALLWKLNMKIIQPVKHTLLYYIMYFLHKSAFEDRNGLKCMLLLCILQQNL